MSIMDQQFSFPLSIIAFLLVILLPLITWKKSKAKTIATPILPPGPRRLPLIGNMHQLLGSMPHRRFRDLANEYGPIMSLQLGQVPHVIISSPEMAKEVMKTHDIIFASRPPMLASSVLVYNAMDVAFAPYGESWRQLRKVCVMELLSAKRVQSFRLTREEEVIFLVKSIASSEGSPVNLSEMITSLSFSITARTAFHQFSKQQDSFGPLIRRSMEALGGLSIADFFPSIKLLHLITGTMRKLKALHQETDAILQNIINEHIGRRGKANIVSDSEEKDLVDVLLNLKENGDLGFSLTMESVKAVLLDIFLGGTETSTTAIEWVMSELLRSPRMMKTAQEEVRQVYGSKGIVDETSLDELKYLQSVIKEALRLHPPGPLLPRETQQRVEINGYEIPIKTKVLVNLWAIGRDPRYWTEPDTFCPERFLNSSISYKGPDYEYLPFGSGRRVCPGILYGMAVVELTLANLLYHLNWKLPNQMKPEDLDMDESWGISVRRKNALYAIPISYFPGEDA